MLNDLWSLKNKLVILMDELMEVENPTTLAPVDVQGAVEFFKNYEELTESLLKPSDYQKTGKKSFKKKSAWRKYATAFNISDEIIDEDIIRDDDYRIISAKYVVKAIASNGRYGYGVASCSIFDKISSKDTVEPSPFELRKRFNNAENDVIATAHTRAKSLAISDIIGTGKVSAEEIDLVKENNGAKKPMRRPKPKATPKAPKKTPKKNEDDVVEGEIVEPSDVPAKKSLKELCEENQNIKEVVEKQKEDPTIIITKDTVIDGLLTKVEKGNLQKSEYEICKKLLENNLH